MNSASELPAVTASIEMLRFQNGPTVSFSPNDVVVIVGPNNAGKSAVLRRIQQLLSGPLPLNLVVQAITTHRSGSITDLDAWLSARSVVQPGAVSQGRTFTLFGQQVNAAHAFNEWRRTDGALGSLTRWFCHLLSAEERLQISNPVGSIAVTRDAPSHPIHVLYRDDALEKRLSAKFRKAFGVDLVVHHRAGNQIPLYVGDRPVCRDGEDRASLSYIERIEALQLLQVQGDGMRSFAGVLLATSAGRESILLIDEPEAFLHPPQARFLGSTLVQNRNKPRQLFVATHSADILRGMLDTESSDIRVIRIRREGVTNVVRVLNNDKIKELWNDPLLRFSNILDGLFHETVVICEAESDCRFYAAMLDATLAAQDSDVKRPDLMFTNCGGKQRLPLVIRALREVDVPVKVVADFDVLSGKDPLKSIVEALGLDWSAVEPDWRAVKSAVDGKKPELSALEVRSEIIRILDQVEGPGFPNARGAEIEGILKRSSSWANAKVGGRSFVPSGEASKACGRLLQSLRAAGLFVVEVGELEGYVRSEGGHGSKWVNAVLSRTLATDPELESARRFVLDLVAPLANRTNTSPSRPQEVRVSD